MARGHQKEGPGGGSSAPPLSMDGHAQKAAAKAAHRDRVRAAKAARAQLREEEAKARRAEEEEARQRWERGRRRDQHLVVAGGADGTGGWPPS